MGEGIGDDREEAVNDAVVGVQHPANGPFGGSVVDAPWQLGALGLIETQRGDPSSCSRGRRLRRTQRIALSGPLGPHLAHVRFRVLL